MITRFVFAIVALLCAGHADAREIVPFAGEYPNGSIVVVTHERQLYFVTGNGQAIRYPVGVGKAGMAWHGSARVERKLVRPSWGPPEDIWRANPNLPAVIPGGAPNNPMGEAVLGLDRGNYAIHGTNDPSSIGRYVSHGCIRMFNQDIVDLYGRVPVGTPVYVLR
jgi:lipoprotein-anchoring transpeptidase ErfK/SrfK